MTCRTFHILIANVRIVRSLNPRISRRQTGRPGRLAPLLVHGGVDLGGDDALLAAGGETGHLSHRGQARKEWLVSLV